MQNEACVCGLGPLSATSLGVLTFWERKDGADYGEFLPPPVVIAVVPTLETHWHLASSRMTRQVLEPAQVSLAGSQSSKVPRKTWLPRDVPWFLLLPSCRGQAQPLELDMWDRHFGKRKKLFSFHCKTKNSVSAVCSSSQH